MSTATTTTPVAPRAPRTLRLAEVPSGAQAQHLAMNISGEAREGNIYKTTTYRPRGSKTSLTSEYPHPLDDDEQISNAKPEAGAQPIRTVSGRRLGPQVAVLEGGGPGGGEESSFFKDICVDTPNCTIRHLLR